MTAKDTWAEALFPFFEGKRDQPPDIKALARLLRSKKRLPAGFRDTLAEILDPQLPHKLAVNYGLEPKWRGRNVKTAKEDRIEALVFEKMPGFLDQATPSPFLARRIAYRRIAGIARSPETAHHRQAQAPRRSTRSRAGKPRSCR